MCHQFSKICFSSHVAFTSVLDVLDQLVSSSLWVLALRCLLHFVTCITLITIHTYHLAVNFGGETRITRKNRIMLLAFLQDQAFNIGATAHHLIPWVASDWLLCHLWHSIPCALLKNSQAREPCILKMPRIFMCLWYYMRKMVCVQLPWLPGLLKWLMLPFSWWHE